MNLGNKKYYSLSNILKRNAYYNLIIGERSNGKTYACLKYAIEQYLQKNEQTALIRRWDVDFTGKRGQVYFNALESNDEISKLTNGEWTGVYYWASKFYLCRYEDDKRIVDETPFCYAFAISQMEHDKSTAYPLVTTIIFDEFISRNGYLPDEFVLFMNVLSTIIRHRKNVRIFMLGNTVNKYCPYFNEMGLKHIKQMEQGKIDLYRYGDSELTVAVEYCKPNKQSKDSDVYFAFNNPKLSMITGGAWEIDIYPHCPVRYKPKEILFTYFIQFDDDLLQCEIIKHEKHLFTYIHRKTTQLKEPEKDLIFSPDFNSLPNYRRKITKPLDDAGKKIARFYVQDKVFYQDNEVGEIVRNYLMWCNE